MMSMLDVEVATDVTRERVVFVVYNPHFKCLGTKPLKQFDNIGQTNEYLSQIEEMMNEYNDSQDRW